MFLTSLNEAKIDLSQYLSYKRNEQITNFIPTNIKKPNTLLLLSSALELISSNFVDRFSDQTFRLFLAAGVHPEFETIAEANLFNTVFGRDMLIQIKFLRRAIELIKNHQNHKLDQKTTELIQSLNSQIPLDAIKFLSIYQGRKTNLDSEEVSGKILHEFRYNDDRIAIELAAARQWKWPYFGSIDATCEYVSLLTDLIREDNNVATVKIKNYFDNRDYTLLECLDMAVKCILNWQAGDGLIYYTRQNPLGIEIQSWRDSFDSISTKVTGLLPSFELPIALYDLQITALQAMENYQELPASLKSIDLDKNQVQLKQAIKIILWLPQQCYFAQAYQSQNNGQKILFDALSSSNLSQIDIPLLKELHPSKINLDKYVDTILKNLESDYGLMTLSPESNRYHPCGYHTGNIWMFDTMLASLNLLDLGYIEQSRLLAYKTINVINQTHLYPELVGKYGHNEVIIDILDTCDNTLNRIVQPGQPLQGWSVMAYVVALLID